MSDEPIAPIEQGTDTPAPVAEPTQTPPSEPANPTAGTQPTEQAIDWTKIDPESIPPEIRDKIAPDWYGKRLGEIKRGIEDDYSKQFEEFTAQFRNPQATATDPSVCELADGTKLPVDEAGMVEYDGMYVSAQWAKRDSERTARLNAYEQRDKSASEKTYFDGVQSAVSKTFTEQFPEDLKAMAGRRAERAFAEVRDGIQGYRVKHGMNPPDEVIQGWVQELLSDDLALAAPSRQKLDNQQALQNGVLPGGAVPAVPGQKTPQEIFATGTPEEREAFLNDIGKRAFEPR